MRHVAKIILLTTIVFIIVIFWHWFFSPEIIAGDWPYFYPSFVNSFNFIPPIWSEIHGNGLGSPILAFGIDTYLYFTGTIFTKFLGFTWPATYKLVWFGAFLIISYSGGFYLYKKIDSSKEDGYAALVGLIYTTNTYILMVVGGGQMGVALAYALLPFIIVFLITLFESLETKDGSWIRSSIFFAFAFGLQTLFDPRLAYISSILIVILCIGEILKDRKGFRALISFTLKLISIFLAIGITILFLNAFWIIPLLIVQQISTGSLGVSASASDVLKFYSFAEFSNAFSLLHPNWPSNIFGKVTFMRPEFLLIPVFAFLILFKKIKNHRVILLALISIIGAFLAKGSNQPLGIIYELMFEHIPGFIMFRDPTKFYILIALAYSILIASSIKCITESLKKKEHIKFISKYHLPTLFFLLIWGILCYPALSMQLGGTFGQNKYASEYKPLNDKISSQNTFFRTLWVPRQSRLANPAPLHPTVEASPLLSATSAAELKEKLKRRGAADYLSSVSIKYIIIPSDPYGEIFLNDRMYSESERNKYEKALNDIPWIKKIIDDKITVYEVSQPKGLFHSKGKSTIYYDKVSSVEFHLSGSSIDEDLIFSQNYHPLWIAELEGKKIKAEKTKSGVMKFSIPDKTNKIIKVKFEGKSIYQKSLAVSIGAFFLLAVALLVLKLIPTLSGLKNYEKK